MNSIWQDIRFGVRMLFKHKLTTLVCVVALALGIGANTAMFSVAEASCCIPRHLRMPTELSRSLNLARGRTST
jgi:hypothetical protein